MDTNLNLVHQHQLFILAQDFLLLQVPIMHMLNQHRIQLVISTSEGGCLKLLCLLPISLEHNRCLQQDNGPLSCLKQGSNNRCLQQDNNPLLTLSCLQGSNNRCLQQGSNNICLQQGSDPNSSQLWRSSRIQHPNIRRP